MILQFNSYLIFLATFSNLTLLALLHFDKKNNKKKKKRGWPIYSPNSCRSNGNAFGNRSSNLMNRVFANNLFLGV